jgi:glycosyltransferase involved in cell wall biosynthesis
MKLLGIDEKKISVVYEGFALPVSTDQECQKLLQQQGIGNNFLLYVGSAYPHKNLEKLIQAFEIIAQEAAGLQLVLVGKLNFFYERLKQYVLDNHPEIKNRVIFAGYLSDEDLSCLYQQAKLYVFPSLIEGFGLPPLEAQAHNLPVISADASCLPEILGASASYFDPNDIKDMAEKISLGLNDFQLRQRLAEAGKINIQRFSWEKMAQEILALYQNS